jgi:hypothetical protein
MSWRVDTTGTKMQIYVSKFLLKVTVGNISLDTIAGNIKFGFSVKG